MTAGGCRLYRWSPPPFLQILCELRCSFMPCHLLTFLHLCPQFSYTRLHQERSAVAGPPQLLPGWSGKLRLGATALNPSLYQGCPEPCGNRDPNPRH